MTQHKDPLHGITLARMVEDLSSYYGWEELGRLIPIRCFTHDPSVSSSLKFLRKTPWARDKVEGLYLYTLRRSQAAGPAGHVLPENADTGLAQARARAPKLPLP